MKKLFLMILLAGSIVYGLWSIASADVPHLINYQGRLTDSGGTPLNGSYNLTFRIYDAETAGNLLWEETQTGIAIQRGIFSILLGSVQNLSLAFDKPYFLEIKVGEELMSPRQRISSVGYALRAEEADHATNADKAKDADSIGGVTSNQLARKQIFTSSGTFIVPSGVTNVYISMVGGGGGGSNSYGGGKGGGSGGYTQRYLYWVTPGNSYTVTIGRGGTGATATGNGTNGTATSFGSLSVEGGQGGISTVAFGTTAHGGLGGNQGGTSFDGTSSRGGGGGIYQGGNGGNTGGTNSGYEGSYGGGNPYGQGGDLSYPQLGGGPAENGQGYGSGGAGGSLYNGAAGNGADGLCIVEW
jgi:hypothetical protein